MVIIWEEGLGTNKLVQAAPASSAAIWELNGNGWQASEVVDSFLQKQAFSKKS